MKRFKTVSVLGDWATWEETRTTGMFRKEKVVNKRVDYTLIDVEALTVQIEDACNELDREGYRIVSVVPITTGRFATGNFDESPRAGYGYGFGRTKGVVILAELKTSS